MPTLPCVLRLADATINRISRTISHGRVASKMLEIQVQFWASTRLKETRYKPCTVNNSSIIGNSRLPTYSHKHQGTIWSSRITRTAIPRAILIAISRVKPWEWVLCSLAVSEKISLLIANALGKVDQSTAWLHSKHNAMKQWRWSAATAMANRYIFHNIGKIQGESRARWAY